MNGPRVKICGLTTPEDVRLCREAGADYLGVILAAGPRRVAPEDLPALRAAAAGARLVGVFVDAEPAAIADAVVRGRLDLVQLHGVEDAATVELVRSATGLPIIKAVRPGELADPETRAAAEAADFVLFDLPKSGPRDAAARDRLWREAADAARARRRVMLAGRIVPADVAAACAQVRPFALDVASGVESAPGRKDPAALARLFEEVAVVRS